MHLYYLIFHPLISILYFQIFSIQLLKLLLLLDMVYFYFFIVSVNDSKPYNKVLIPDIRNKLINNTFPIIFLSNIIFLFLYYLYNIKKMDYCIIGAGPCGLTLAWILSKNNFKVTIIDRENDIGGCHRVRRVKDNNDNFFTEHGPRIYLSSFLNTIKWFRDMDMDFFKYFSKYNFNFSSIGDRSIKNIKFFELFWFGYESIRMIFNDLYSKQITCLDFMEKHNFSLDTIDYIDRICRLTDGVGSDKYTLFEFLQLINQNGLYSIYQPNKPNDIGIFHKIKSKLINNGVKFIFNTKINNIIVDKHDSNKISHITGLSKHNTFGLYANNFIFAIPPVNLVQIIQNNPFVKNSFGQFDIIKQWAHFNNYNIYVSITFHWNQNLQLPKVWGFPLSDWGIAYIVLSDYMTFDNQQSKTVISCCITKPEAISTNINKTIDQCSNQELINETFRQLKINFPNLQTPTKSFISPGDYKFNNKWLTKDTAYMMTTDIANHNPIQFASVMFNNLYSVGSHNRYSKYHFTSMESAVTNAIAVSSQLLNVNNKDNNNNNYMNDVILQPIPLIDNALVFVIAIICIVFLFFYYK